MVTMDMPQRLEIMELSGWDAGHTRGENFLMHSKVLVEQV